MGEFTVKKLIPFVLFFLWTPVFAASNVVYIAFQESTAAADTSKTWNDFVDMFAINDKLTNMDDEDGNATVFDIEILDPPFGDIIGGASHVGTGDAAWVDETIISREQHVTTGGGANDLARYQFQGLDNGKTYSLEIYCTYATGATTTRTLEVSHDGFTTVHGTLECFGNSTGVIKLDSLSPSSGNIDLSWRNTSGELAPLNAIKFTEDIASGALLLRRRR